MGRGESLEKEFVNTQIWAERKKIYREEEEDENDDDDGKKERR